MTTPHNITSDVLVRSGKRPIHAGDDYDYCFKVKRSGTWLNLTDGTVWFTVKEDISDSDSEALLQYCSTETPLEIEITVPTQGTFILHLAAADTENLAGTWNYDVKAKLVTGKFIRIAWGKFQFLPNVTQTRPA